MTTFCSLQTAAAPYFLSQSGQECVSFTQGPCRWQWTCYTSRLCTSGGRCQTSPRGSNLAEETCHATRENPPGRFSYVAESLQHARWIRRCAMKRRSEEKKCTKLHALTSAHSARRHQQHQKVKKHQKQSQPPPKIP